MLDYHGDTHLYLQIAEIMRQRIDGLTAGHPVPSEADIQKEFGVARTTARRAIHVLREEGLIYTVQGEGTFVGNPGEARAQPAQDPAVPADRGRHRATDQDGTASAAPPDSG
ncbi:GntR family transcriptional regulator [Nonomuraea dietziae]|uniref:GntR family transcriptional regulator n=1 Tax=Nonomuraea dietziae TaxID=65515 RepID=UPI0031D71276